MFTHALEEYSLIAACVNRPTTLYEQIWSSINKSSVIFCVKAHKKTGLPKLRVPQNVLHHLKYDSRSLECHMHEHAVSRSRAPLIWLDYRARFWFRPLVMSLAEFGGLELSVFGLHVKPHWQAREQQQQSTKNRTTVLINYALNSPQNWNTRFNQLTTWSVWLHHQLQDSSNA